jgi:uncharacterized protein (TIGR02246 family)
MKGVAIEARAEVQEIEVFGPRAYIRNHVRVELTSPGQAPKRVSGYAMSILRKDADGRWRIAATPIWSCRTERAFGATDRRRRMTIDE